MLDDLAECDIYVEVPPPVGDRGNVR